MRTRFTTLFGPASQGLAMALASNLTTEAAVDKWVLKYKSLGDGGHVRWYADRRQQKMERFIQAVDDSVKASVMKKNKKQWAGIREDVKAWGVAVGGGET